MSEKRHTLVDTHGPSNRRLDDVDNSHSAEDLNGAAGHPHHESLSSEPSEPCSREAWMNDKMHLHGNVLGRRHSCFPGFPLSQRLELFRLVCVDQRAGFGLFGLALFFSTWAIQGRQGSVQRWVGYRHGRLARQRDLAAGCHTERLRSVEESSVTTENA